VAYNKYICGVDRMNQLNSDYSPLRKTLKWYRKVVLQHLEMAMTNAFLLYQKSRWVTEANVISEKRYYIINKFRLIAS